MITGTISHDEAMIKDFMEHPDYAKELLDAVQSDGDDYEKQRVLEWYNEAKKRTQAEALDDWEDYNDALRICAEVDAGRMKVYSLDEGERHLYALEG